MNNTEDHENSKESSVDEEIGSSSDNTEESADAALSEAVSYTHLTLPTSDLV